MTNSTASEAAPGICPAWPVYGLEAGIKRARLEALLSQLTRHHAERCEAYRRILRARGVDWRDDFALERLPWLPVRLFKEAELRSVDTAQVVKTLSSSGTTSARVSRIYLDRETSLAQSRALVSILQTLLGRERLPMLILDHPGVIRDRVAFSARGAGILGLSTFGRNPVYALKDGSMEIDMDVVEQFAERYAGQRKLLFGFTFMAWKYFMQPLLAQARRLDLSQAILIHSGGWKKLLDEAVPPAVFKSAARQAANIESVHNFYGMVEQAGSIFLECEAGHLHASSWSEVLVRDPFDWSLCPPGRQGLIQVMSVLPHSYPGHSLLTEDLGRLLGEDDCACGRHGKYFAVDGRLPRAELRGCSDTHAVPA